MHLHLDLLGGIAGDMFIAAVLDARPEELSGMLASIAAVGTEPAVECRLLPFRDHVLQGARFEVQRVAAGEHGDGHDAVHCRDAGNGNANGHGHGHGHGHEHEHDDNHEHGHDHGPAVAQRVAPGGQHTHRHDHVPWRDLRQRLTAAPIPAEVRRHALAIFALLADAEAAVHGVAVDEVTFHEVGAWDSVADIVGAAHLIAALASNATAKNETLRWSVGAVPLGSGRVLTDHGWMPVPAPATASLLRGFHVEDDGIAGERVTPTGAAILRYLCPPDAGALRPRGRIVGHGTGFGTRLLPGTSNCVRLLVLDDAALAADPTADPGHGAAAQVAVVEFELDDQSPESLAHGLDRLRAVAGVIDVVQSPAHGKKGRIGAAVRLLVQPDALPAAVRACFDETTTLGLRHHLVDRVVLRRQAASVVVDGHTVRAKIADRPSGRTAKAEADDLSPHAVEAQRAQLARRSAAQALADTATACDPASVPPSTGGDRVPPAPAGPALPARDPAIAAGEECAL